MDWYKYIKIFYDWGYYNEETVYQFVNNRKITLEQADEITGKNIPE